MVRVHYISIVHISFVFAVVLLYTHCLKEVRKHFSLNLFLQLYYVGTRIGYSFEFINEAGLV